MSLATIAILAALIGQTPKVDGRVQFMKGEAAAYQLKKRGDRAASLKFQPEPVFRLGKQPADDVEDGAIFFWIGEDGRPEASLQIFLVKNAAAPNGMWAHEFDRKCRTSRAGGRTATRRPPITSPSRNCDRPRR